MRQEVLAAVGQSGYVDCSDNSSGGSSGKTQHKKRPLPMPMVDACIRESQRLYPVAPFVVRRLSTDLRLKDGKEPLKKAGVRDGMCFLPLENLKMRSTRRNDGRKILPGLDVMLSLLLSLVL